MAEEWRDGSPSLEQLWLGCIVSDLTCELSRIDEGNLVVVVRSGDLPAWGDFTVLAGEFGGESTSGSSAIGSGIVTW